MAHTAPYAKEQQLCSWRSPTRFIVMVISFALLTEYFLFSFIIPILPNLLEDRVRVSPSRTQLVTSMILSMNAIVSMAIGPVIGYLSDRTRHKTTLMQTEYLIHIVGTGITAWSTTLADLFIGRLIQTIAGSLLWIAGIAILERLLAGPVVAGALFNSVPYALTWLSTFVLLLVGFGLQSLMLEPHAILAKSESNVPVSEEQSETDSLLQSVPPEPLHDDSNYRSFGRHHEKLPSAPARSTDLNWKLLCKRRAVAALIAESVVAMLISSGGATIPLHINHIFNWGSMQAGILFFLFQLPTLLLVFPAA